MNIKEAKKEIENTLRAYLLRGEDGRYRFPVVRQRPVLLMGPPGIGKTAILQQIAEQAGVGLVSYTLTHHTRQSAVGLPRIEKKCFCGEEMTVTEYTMSEIIASLYEYMESTGKREGILFLDEINCVSETLAPTMLQLLQNKTFGCHRIPEGWILVAAGNPPEYNKSVREFDVATLDRVRTIVVEPDCGVWLEYARRQQVHSAIVSYLTIHPEQFYLMEEQEKGMRFVTARGWEDLSELLKSYEILDVPVTAQLAGQYLQQEETAKGFTAYYRLFRKYEEDYGLEAILGGSADPETWQRKAEMARSGGFEERFTVVRLLTDGLTVKFRDWNREGQRLEALRQALLRLKRSWNGGPGAAAKAMEKSLQVRKNAGLLTQAEQEKEKWVISRLEELELQGREAHLRQEEDWFAAIRQSFREQTEAFQKQAGALGDMLHRAFRFAEKAFGEGQELTLLMTELSESRETMDFITENGSDDFLRHGQVLAFRSHEKTLVAQCRKLME